MESKETTDSITESTISGQKSNPEKHVFEIEIPQAKETDTLLSGTTKPTGIRLLSWYWDSYICNSLAAAFFLSALNCMIKVLSDNYSVFQIAVVRSVFIVGIFVPVSYAQRLPLFGPPNKYKLLIIRGILGASGFITCCIATVLLPLSESAFLTAIYPAVTAFISWILAMEKLNWISWTGIIGTILGNSLIAHPPFIFGGHEDWGLNRVVGIVTAIVNNLLTSGAFFVVGKLGTSVPTITAAFYQALCTLIISLCLLIVYTHELRLHGSGVDIALLLGVGFASLLNLVSVTRALQIGPPTRVVMLIMTSMFLSSAFGFVALSESMTWVSATGSAIILVSVMSVASQKQKIEG
eukprot:g8090.t1